MGLDQYIYKRNKNYAPTLHQLEVLNKESNDYTQALVQSPEVKTTIAQFIQDIQHSLQSVDHEYNITRITQSAASIIYGNNDPDQVKWDLFNNCSVFNFDYEDSYQLEVANNLISMLSDYKLSPEQLARLSKEEELQNMIDSSQTEVAYWRKHYDLNDFILETFGGGNCEDTPLTLDDMYRILEFQEESEFDTSKLTAIIDAWDNSATYVYHPWW